MNTLGQIILTIIERLSSFGGKNVLKRMWFIRGSTVYKYKNH